MIYITNDDFFSKQTNKAPTMDEQSVIKVGEKEYSQDELSRLVGLGETAQEYESKWNRKITDLYPDYTQKSQKLAEFEKQQNDFARQEAERRQQELESKVRNNSQELTPEEERQIAIQQAKELGIATKDDLSVEINKALTNALAAKQLIEDIGSVINQAKEKGQPNTDVGEMLKFMEETGVRNPEKAYKLRFEDELDRWKEEKIKTIRPSGMQTQELPTAGGKQPPPPQSLTKENLGQAIRDSLTRSHGI